MVPNKTQQVGIVIAPNGFSRQPHYVMSWPHRPALPWSIVFLLTHNALSVQKVPDRFLKGFRTFSWKAPQKASANIMDCQRLRNAFALMRAQACEPGRRLEQYSYVVINERRYKCAPVRRV